MKSDAHKKTDGATLLMVKRLLKKRDEKPAADRCYFFLKTIADKALLEKIDPYSAFSRDITH